MTMRRLPHSGILDLRSWHSDGLLRRVDRAGADDDEESIVVSSKILAAL
jgi:hypothetical protein